jgi:hypothetical protein
LILIHVILSNALGMNVPAAAYIVVVPLTSILLLVPSIAGIGVRESAFVYLLESFTANVALGAALGILVLMQNIISGVIGWVWYMVYSLRRQGVAEQPNAPHHSL